MDTLYTGHAIVTRLADIGRLRAPVEAAGFLFPGGRIIELANRSSEPTRSFEFGPDDVRLALEVSDFIVTDSDWANATLWHTHPGGSIGPSFTDMRNKVGAIEHLVIALTEDGDIPTYY